MITLDIHQYKTINSVDLCKVKMIKYEFEIDGVITLWFREGFLTKASDNDSFTYIKNSTYSPPGPFTISLSKEEKEEILTANSGKLSVGILEKFVISKGYLIGTFDG